MPKIDQLIFMDYNQFMKSTILLLISFFLMTASFAQIKTYKGTFNEPITDEERFDKVEKFLIPLSKQINSLHKKIDALREEQNTKLGGRIDALEKRLEQIAVSKPAGASKNNDLAEIKASLKTIKEDHIPILNAEVEFLKDAFKATENLIKTFHSVPSKPSN